MKCNSVHEAMVEYVEGGLGPADEMCVDIHLIQCDQCRAEAAALRAMLRTISANVRACPDCEDHDEFLQRLHHSIETEPPRDAGETSQFGVPLARLSAAAAVAALLLASGLLGRFGPAWTFELRPPVAEARTVEISSVEWNPQLRKGLDLVDFAALGMVADGSAGRVAED